MLAKFYTYYLEEINVEKINYFVCVKKWENMDIIKIA